MSGCERGLHFSRSDMVVSTSGNVIQDRLGFLDHTPWVPDSRFFVSKTWILDSSYSGDSGFLEQYSESQSSGFPIPQAKYLGYRNLVSHNVVQTELLLSRTLSFRPI